MRGVVWTDVFQCAVMFGGLLTIMVYVRIFKFLHFSMLAQHTTPKNLLKLHPEMVVGGGGAH